jgi:hypothetical protein
MKFTKSDHIAAIKHFFDISGMQAPIPMQSLCSLIVLTGSEAEKFQHTHTISKLSVDEIYDLADDEARNLKRFPVWMWNIKILPSLLLRLPIWRGDKPFYEWPESSEETLKIVMRCFREHGVNVEDTTRQIAALFQGV